ncbi:MAG: cyclic nucleotide-binding domain-containing protein [Deltaproteobacteria bacterium]|nr:cyclic nucleotide-binding domain-containing protein [Deltaproteobacteria bacterium]
MTKQEISHQTWLKSVVGKDLSDGEARELFMISRRERFKKGDKLFDEGEAAVALFLVADGTVEIGKKIAGGKEHTAIASLHAGAIVGEMSLLTKEKRSASAVVTSEHATVLRVSWKDFEELLAQNPAVAYKLMYALARVLAARLRSINARLAEAAERSLDANPHEQVEEFQAFKKRLFSDWSF